MSREVKITEAVKKEYLINEENKPISVCAYCRVSTDKNDQKNSFDAQKRFFNSFFDEHKNWKTKTIFADLGISGTSLKKRDKFKQMIREAKNGKYSIIITKEVSRFSRNVQDTLNIVTELHNLGVYVLFLTEDIYTETPDYREQLIKASEQAEAESRKTSKRVLWGQRRQMENGVVFGRLEMFGYNIKRDNLNNQYFDVIPEEAELVRRIFTMYSEGMGTFKIAKQLESEGIKTKRYKNGWSNTVILRMLRNEKYVGDLEQGKTYTTDCLTHQKKYNRGESAKIYIKNHHPESAIVGRKLWNKVQKLLKENEPSEATKKQHSNRYWCSGKVFCGECGTRYISHIKHLKNGSIYKSWKCWESQQRGAKKTITQNGEKTEVGCNSESVNDKVLKQGVYDIITQLIKPNFNSIYENIKTEYESKMQSTPTDNEKKIKELQEQIETIKKSLRHSLDLLSNGDIDSEEYKYLKSKKNTEISEIEKDIENLSANGNENEEIKAEMEKHLAELETIINLENEKINEDVFRNIVEKIEVYNNHLLKFYFIGLSQPICLTYETKGKMETYEIDFKIVNV